MTDDMPKILVVDDDHETTNIFELVLAKLEGEVTITRDVPSAMAYLEDNTPALILLDIMLPGQIGLDVLAHVRGYPPLSGVKIVIISAHSLASYTLPEGVQPDAVLRKPIRIPELQKLMAQLLG